MSYDLRRRSADRAVAIAAELTPASTVLDFGAHKGAIAAALAGAGHQVTAVAPDLPDIPGVRCIRSLMSPAQIRRLPVFDYTLALSVLHHQDDWQATYDALHGRTRVALFVETPDADEWVPRPDGLPGAFDSYPVVCVAPGFRAGHMRRTVRVDV